MRILLIALAFAGIANAEPLTYSEAWSASLKSGKPLVVFVGVDESKRDGSVTCRVGWLNGYPAKCVVTLRPTSNDRCSWVSTEDKTPAGAAVDALDLLNSQRSARGLPPFIRDEGLSQAAAKCAAHRAANRISGHCGGSGDFAFLPDGSRAEAAGCACWPNDGTFGACCAYERWARAGAATCIGADGRAYHHLFVR